MVVELRGGLFHLLTWNKIRRDIEKINVNDIDSQLQLV
jgi:hypothetical protein